ncbi:hypothetical protein Msi02_56730 [Microbispora siamensis]|uniref:LPXTG cell wall anchor domain-containing protein n=1 Tax=Microbispora siamensis TaxID=564413 RepID=A0ABQ4GTT4_9ACTN|nr:hypothetical protein Msi02_56730 [Microbispora siamensis]
MGEARKFLFPGLLLLLVDALAMLVDVDLGPWPIEWGIFLAALVLIGLGLIVLSRSQNRS